MDLSNLTNDELRDHVRAGIHEAEKRLTGRRLKTLKLIHALAEQIEQDSVTSGDVSLRSDGGPKD